MGDFPASYVSLPEGMYKAGGFTVLSGRVEVGRPF